MSYDDSEHEHHPYRFRIDLPADVSAIGAARRFVRDSLRRLDTASPDAELAVSEMFTAAIAGTGEDDRIEVEVRRRGDEIDVDVCSTHVRRDDDPVHRSTMQSMMGSIADFYDRRDIGDTEVQSYGCSVVRRVDERCDGLHRPASTSTTGAKASGSRTT